MLKALRRLLNHLSHAGAAEPARPACVEPLEKRSLLAGAPLEAAPVSAAEEPDVTPPTLVNEQLFGSDPRNVEGVVLTFSEPLDPASAQEIRNYRVGTRTDRQQRTIDEDDDRFRRNRRGLVRFETPVYNPADLTVTLTAVDPFNITRRFRTIRVLGRDDRGVRDVAGNVLDGDANGRPRGDAVEQFTFRRASTVSYGERDGDNVTLSLKGPGRLWVIRQTGDGKVLARGQARRVFIDKADPARSILTGKVSGRGNGVAVIEELVNAGTAQVQIATDPAFQIVRSIA